jgi:hypothetical protein
MEICDCEAVTPSCTNWEENWDRCRVEEYQVFPDVLTLVETYCCELSCSTLLVLDV